MVNWNDNLNRIAFILEKKKQMVAEEFFTCNVNIINLITFISKKQKLSYICKEQIIFRYLHFSYHKTHQAKTYFFENRRIRSACVF